MSSKKSKRLVDVLDGIDKLEVQYTKVIPKLHKLMNIIRSSVISERREYDYSFVEGMVKDIEQNKCVISKLDLQNKKVTMVVGDYDKNLFLSSRNLFLVNMVSVLDTFHH